MRSPWKVARFAVLPTAIALLIGSTFLAYHLANVPSAAGAVNLLANAGFELDADANGKPDAWSTGNLFTRSSTAAHTGSFSGRFQSTTNKGQTSYQQVAITGGVAYDVSGWVNIPTTADSFTFQLKVQWRGSSGSIGAIVLRKYTDDTLGTWQQAMATLTAPAGATDARVQLVAANLNGTIYVDDLSFGSGSASTPPPTPTDVPSTPGNIMANPSFETDANADGRPDGWTTNAAFTRSTTVPRSGAYAGSHTSTGNAGYTVYQQVAVLGGQGYTFAGHVNAPTTADGFTFTLRVQWRTASSAISTTDLQRFTDDTGGSWQLVTANVAAPANAVSARVQMVVGSLAATINVDDFSLAPVSDGGGAPVNMVLPTISPPGPERSAHFARTGTWTGGTITYGYQWFRCSDTSVCSPIDGATTERYEVVTDDIGERLRADVTATNSAGSTTASSAVSEPVPPRAVPSPNDPVIAVAGDIACDPDSGSFNGGLGTATKCRQKATSDLLVGQDLSAVIITGDSQYPDGTYDQFLRSYDLSWGRLNGITRPSPGNHEYHTTGAAGYHRYFGSAAGNPAEGWYSFDVDGWHIIALNSNCNSVSCAAGSAQEQWLRADLAASTADCTLAYWHHPRFSSGVHGSDTDLSAFWTALYEYGADVVMSGHDHNYERFAPLAPSGSVDDSYGIRSFVVGTGGAGLRALPTVVPGSEARDSTSHGILELSLDPDGYDWAFIPATGASFTDAGSGECHGAPGGSPVEEPPDSGVDTVTAAVETAPVPHARDAADDAAFWVNPADPSLSTIIGTDKQAGGGLFVYDLSGAVLSAVTDHQMANVDLRESFSLGSEHVSLVAGSGLGSMTIFVYRVDAVTRGLVPVSAAPIMTGMTINGLCMYRSGTDGSYYVFVDNSSGVVQQWRVADNGSGLVAGTLVREFDVGSAVEACVADDELGHFYVSEETVGIWRYGAEPGAGTDRVLVDVAGPPGHLTADIEGLVVVPGGGGGYLVASSQGSDSYVIYDRDDSAHLGTFQVVDSPSIDGTQNTDGIDVTTAALGPAFPNGAFVAQDGQNPGANQNFKLVPWDEILAAVGLVAGTGATVTPMPI